MCLFLSRPFCIQINYGMISLFTRPRLYTKRIFYTYLRKTKKKRKKERKKHQLLWCMDNTIYIYGQLIYDEGAKSNIQWREIVSSISGGGETRQTHIIE